MSYLSIIIAVARGKTLLRSLMNQEIKQFTLQGNILDIGGGQNPSYLTYFKRAPGVIRTVADIERGENTNIVVDLEHDQLPYVDGSFEQVLMLNFLEHVYDYRHVMSEATRVLKKGGELLGFVPFLMNVHPDPHDYFRYTGEALHRIFTDAGFHIVTVRTVGIGPLSVAFNIATSFVPGFVTVIFFPFVFVLDLLLIKFRPHYRDRYPLGYLFKLTKN